MSVECVEQCEEALHEEDDGSDEDVQDDSDDDGPGRSHGISFLGHDDDEEEKEEEEEPSAGVVGQRCTDESNKNSCNS